MKTIIYWFSGTGNSLAVAKELAKQCGDTELIPMFQWLDPSEAREAPLLRGNDRREWQKSPPPAERIGLVFPVYAWGPPSLVVRFIERLNAAPGTYIFSVVTYAGNMGGTLSTLRSLLQKRELDLAAGWGVKMPENYPPFGGAPEPGKQQKINHAAEEKITQIAVELQQSPRGKFETSAAAWRMLSRAVYPLFRKFMPRADRFFRADDKCNGCGICEKICPVKNVEMTDGKPKWLGHCEQCYACFHWCPQQAVQYGYSSKQVRYHHPATAVADFIARTKPIQ
ncbi:MAG: EFR1 family ferrodoxin [Kiritimatiellales bacterium]